MFVLNRPGNLPLFQCSAHRVMNRIKDTDGTLITQITLCSIVSLNSGQPWDGPHQKHIDSSLFPFVLEIIDVGPRNALGGVAQNTCIEFIFNIRIKAEPGATYQPKSSSRFL